MEGTLTLHRFQHSFVRVSEKRIRPLDIFIIL